VTSTRQILVGFGVGVVVGNTVGRVVGDAVGITVGEGVVGAGVLVVGNSVGVDVGPPVGMQFSNGSKWRLISLNRLGLKGDRKSFHVYIPYGGT